MRYYCPKGNTTALVYGSYKQSFPTFFKEIDKVAAGLYAMGVRAGDVVTIALPNIPQSVVVTYALSKLGAIASMIHPLVSADQFGELVEKQKPKVVFLSNINFFKFYSRRGDARVVLCTFFTYNYLGLPLAHKFEEYKGDGSEPMFYIQSGGTAGQPKTIVLSSRSMNAMASNLLDVTGNKFDCTKAMLTVMPMFHCFGLGAGMHAPLCGGSRIVLVPQFKVKKITKLICKNGVTAMIAVPRMISKLLQYDEFSLKNIRTLEDMYVGGDMVTDDLVDRFNERMEAGGSTCTLAPGYGMSETVICVLSRPEYKRGSVGKPIVNVECRVVDESLAVVANGTTGELLVSSMQIMNGYLDDEEATSATIVDIDGKKWVRTGDLFKMDDEGFLYYMGRKKRLIKISGVNVFPNEIERVACELDCVQECAAIECFNNGKNYIKLIVEGHLDDNQKKMVIAHIAKRLSHWNTPSCVECMDELPRTKFSKIDFQKLTCEQNSK